MKSNWRNTLVYFVAILIGLALVAPFFTGVGTEKEIALSEFLNQVEKGQVASVRIAGDTAHGTLQNGDQFRARVGNYPELVSVLRTRQVAIKMEAPAEGGWFWNIVLQLLLPLLFFGGLWFLLIRQAQSTNTQALSFGKSRAKPFKGKMNITFKDVAGIDEAKEELQEVVEFLKHSQKFLDVGARIPKGVILVGPPGTGKTLLAKAVAGEAGVPFYSISGSDFVELFVGVGASRVRDVFAQAKKSSPCIIFIDEIDAVGRHRGAGLGGGHDEREQTLNQLLVEMDGFDIKTNIVIIAATNRPDILDPALLRPGRFDRQVILDKPDLKGRLEILKIHSKGKPLENEADLEVIARGTPGFTGADLENLMNEAAILAARKNQKIITTLELQSAEERVIAGPEKKSRVISEHEKEVIAHHEVGHAIVARLTPKTDPVHKISILPRGMALGYTMQLPTEDRYLVEKQQLLGKVAVMLGGRVAEELIFGEVTSGAHNDLENATQVVRRMVCELGMSALGLRTFGKVHRHVFLGRDIAEDRDYGDETASLIDKEIQATIEECYNRAKDLLSSNIDKLKKLAQIVKEKETLEGESLEAAFASVGLPSEKPAGKPVPKKVYAPAPQPEGEAIPTHEKRKPGESPGSTAPQPAY